MYQLFHRGILVIGCLFISEGFTLSDSHDLSYILKSLILNPNCNNNNNTDVSENTFCHPAYCQVNNTCIKPLLCESIGCNVTQCRDPNLTTTTVFYSHHCADHEPNVCPGSTICIELIGCRCLRNWTGQFGCNTECHLQCAQGICMISNETMFCNCESSWEGKLCDKPSVDYKAKEEQERLARMREEKQVRIMYGVMAASLTAALIVAIVLPVVLWRLRVIFVMKLVYYFKNYEDNDDKLYDVYVSMTPTANAEKFVYGDLRPKLENLGFKLYLQARDCQPGQVMSESILEAVEKSRCTIMIVTPDYITNEWNRFEYLIAQHETIKLNQKIIPIILELIDKANMDKSLKHILDSVKCLKHPSIKFSTPTESRSNFYRTMYSLQDKINSNNGMRFGGEEKLQNKYEADIGKFWKRLALTLPKKKNQKPEIVDTVEGDISHIAIKNMDYRYKTQTRNEHSYGTINKGIGCVQLRDTLIAVLE